MASFTTLPSGKTRAFVMLKGVRNSKAFITKAEAKAWAARVEADILAGDRGDIPDKTFGELLSRYRDEVSPTKKGVRYEAVRINRIVGNDGSRGGNERPADLIAAVKLCDLDGTVVALWRDRRLASGVCGETVRREWNQLASACSVAVSEWKWLKINPFSKGVGVKRPQRSKAREELFSPEDLEVLQARAESQNGADTHRRVMLCVRWCCETAMRAGEMLYLGDNPKGVNTLTRVARLPDTKNGKSREVALSAEALRIWAEVRALGRTGNAWGFNSQTLDVEWRALRDATAKAHPEVRRLHFHDTRHTAITKLAKKLQVLDLARMTGHTDLKQLMQYYNEGMDSIALRL